MGAASRLKGCIIRFQRGESWFYQKGGGNSAAQLQQRKGKIKRHLPILCVKMNRTISQKNKVAGRTEAAREGKSPELFRFGQLKETVIPVRIDFSKSLCEK